MDNFDIISDNVIFYLLKYLDNYSVFQAIKRVLPIKRSVTQVLCKGDCSIQGGLFLFNSGDKLNLWTVFFFHYQLSFPKI